MRSPHLFPPPLGITPENSFSPPGETPRIDAARDCDGLRRMWPWALRAMPTLTRRWDGRYPRRYGSILFYLGFAATLGEFRQPFRIPF